MQPMNSSINASMNAPSMNAPMNPSMNPPMPEQRFPSERKMVHPRSELSLRVPIAFMGGLIGYNGETLRKVQQETEAGIKVFPKDARNPRAEMRQVMITKEVVNGIEGIFAVFNRELEEASRGQLARLGPDHKFIFKVDVAANQIGAVIGRQGTGARHIRDVSGCHVRIQGEGEVQLTGKLSQVKRAIHGVWDAIKEIPSLYNIMRVPESFYRSPLAGPHISVVLHLPDDVVGMLIGRNGETISSIRRECVGVKIDIENVNAKKHALQQQQNATGSNSNSNTNVPGSNILSGNDMHAPLTNNGPNSMGVMHGNNMQFNTYSNQPHHGAAQHGQPHNQHHGQNQQHGQNNRHGQNNLLTREIVLRGTMRATCRAHQMIAALIENDVRKKNRQAQSMHEDKFYKSPDTTAEVDSSYKESPDAIQRSPEELNN